MPHFGIESLGHGTGGFLDQIASSPIVTGLTGTRTVTGTPTTIISAGFVESGLSTRRIQNQIDAIIDRIRVGSPQFQFEQVQVPLFELGQASLDITSALNEQITIREDQRAVDLEAVRNLQIAQTSINEAFTKTLGDISKSIGDIGKGGFDPIGFLTDNPLLGGIGIGGLAVGAVVLLLVLRR